MTTTHVRTLHRRRMFGAHLLGAVLVLLVGFALTACGGKSGAGSPGNLSVSVSKPASGATVTVPFTVDVTSSVPLGKTDTGQHHVHIWFDDNASNYIVVESNTVQVTSLTPGSHVMHVSLRNANHSAAGAEFQESLTVTGATGSPGPTESPSPGTTYRYPY